MAAKLVNQALVGIHAQAACESIELAHQLGLNTTNGILKELLVNSWGQSKVLDLVMTDYISASQNPDIIPRNDHDKTPLDGNKSSGHIRLTVGEVVHPSVHQDTVHRLARIKSAAPLRNMVKDFNCIQHDIKGSSKYALLERTTSALNIACNQAGLNEAPFAALIDLINNPNK